MHDISGCSMVILLREIPITNVNIFVLHNILTNGFHIMIICNVTVLFS